MGRVILFANGEFSSLGFYKNLLQEDDYIICADGGVNTIYPAGIIPDLLVGDFDSVEEEILDKLKSEKTEFLKYPKEKDESDLELALLKAIELKPEEIMIFAALGKRLDHIFANLMLLNLPLENDIKCSLIEEDYEIFLINKHIKIKRGKAVYLSLFPLTPVVEAIETYGLKYLLKSENLYLGPSRGLSNEIIEEEATIKIKNGKLLIIKTNN